MFRKVVLLLSMALLSTQAFAATKEKDKDAAKKKEEKKEEVVTLNAENVIYLELKDGRVVIELLPQLAPNHVVRVKELTREKFYDGVVFHRVIDGFMAQTGDPSGTGMGGSNLPNLKAEFNPMPHVRGTVSMARAGTPDSANSQFFICLNDANFLDRQYTVFGRVISGMEFVDKIKKGDSNNNGAVVDPDHIVSMKVAADVDGDLMKTETKLDPDAVKEIAPEAEKSPAAATDPAASAPAATPVVEKAPEAAVPAAATPAPAAAATKQ